MPNISLDFFYDLDFANITVTRSQGAPKAKPAWKVRQAPKLPPKPKALPATSSPRPSPRPKINATRFPNGSSENNTSRIEDVTDKDEASKPAPTPAAPKKNLPKLKDNKPKNPPSTASVSKPAKNTKPQTNGWVLNKVSDAIRPTVSNTVATAGGFAGDVVSTVGSSINGVGQSINSAISGYGNGAKDYGNAIKDWSKAPGTRTQSASNPLGLSDTVTGGKRGVTSPSAPKKASTWTPAAPSSPQKALPASATAARKPNTTLPSKPVTASAKPRPSSINTSKPTATPMAGKASSTKSVPTPSVKKAGSVKSPNTPVKRSPISKPAPVVRPRVQGTAAGAKNPLGL